MIDFQDVTKTVVTRFKQERRILSSVRLQIPSNEAIAVFSSAREHTPIFMNLLAGLIVPDSGHVIRHARVSFPIGPVGGFDLRLSVRHNVAFAAGLYGADIRATVEFVKAISGLRDAYEHPFGHLPPAEIRRIVLIIAYSLPFDLYVHTTDVASPTFRKQLGSKVLALMEARLASSGVIFPSRNLRTASEFCDTALILHQGSLHLVRNILRMELALLQISRANPRMPQPALPQLKEMFGKL